ncbi:MAG: F0F1 ATP synthase subunit epsilon [Anaerolineae bacterium]|nr:F0F1 ATP synthase subunit epsilon [Anaerolineae bacterium]
MNLKISLPTGLLYEGQVRKVSAEAANGSFMMLPRHIDFVTYLIPGILFFDTAGEEPEEIFFAVDEGILVKRGPDVWVSTRNAVRSTDLKALHRTINEHFEVLNQHERLARSVLSRMEADFMRRFLELEG